MPDAATPTPTLPASPAGDSPLAPQSIIAGLIANVSANPAQVAFPADQWGFTSGTRKAVLAAASTIRGQQDKHDLLLQTLAVLAAHIKKRFPIDAQEQATRIADAIKAADAADQLQRQHGTPVTPTYSEEQAVAILTAAGYQINKD